MTVARIGFGERAPLFSCRTTGKEPARYDLEAGCYVVLTLFGSARQAKCLPALRFIVEELGHHFDDKKVCFLGVSIDPADRGINSRIPGIRFTLDARDQISEAYGSKRNPGAPLDEPAQYSPYTLVLDPSLRVMEVIPLGDANTHNRHLQAILERLASVDDYAEVTLHAPVLIVPRVLDTSLCKHLIRLYQTHGGEESGSMIDRDGQTLTQLNPSFKRRQDHHILDEPTIEALRSSIALRLAPEIERSFHFKPTRIERYMVARYDSESGGFFKPHRDNTTKATVHRRFACTINLNAEEYEGGELRFPEFGTRTYRAPTGGAIVFSCSLLHEATPVTRGTRYATLPFLYDDAAEQIRKANLKFLSSTVIHVGSDARDSPS